MPTEKRSAERISIRLTVSVQLKDEKSGTVLADPEKGEARNFSPKGLALSLDNIRFGNIHVFFACQDNPEYILNIGFTLPEDDGGTIEIPARPVWYDRDREAGGERALLGLKFLIPPRDKAIKKLARDFFAQEKTPASWWQKIF